MNHMTIHNSSNLPATRQERDAALRVLLATMAFHDDADPADVTAAYHIALEGYPLEPIRRAVMRFMRGEVDGQSLSFVPKAPELGREVSRIHVAMQPPVKRPVWTPEPERIAPTPEEKANVRAYLEASRRRAAQSEINERNPT